jgi:2-(1,2-epoxy-1,2-dihydrophenyl)acetyl-CoA isomerase
MEDAARASVLIERQGQVATVVINRPERRNALDDETKSALVQCLADVATDQSVRAVILTGSGGAFCVGQDLAEHAEALKGGAAEAFSTVEEHYSSIVRTLMTMAKPVVGAVNGTCVGAGLGFALACDLRVFSSAATLGTAFSSIGLTCDSGLSHTLPRAVGEARARELVLLARPFTPVQAVGWGITGEIVEPDMVQARATELATELAAGPTSAYAASKELLSGTWVRDLDQALLAEAAAQVRVGGTADHAGAVSAFLAKQRPSFSGK